MIRLCMQTITVDCASGSRRKMKNIARISSSRPILNKMVDIIDESGASKSVRITGYGKNCFEVNNVYISQPVIAFKDTYVLWNIKPKEKVTLESLYPVYTYFPTVDILFLGLGNSPDRTLSKEVVEGLKKKGIVVEVASTFHTASTFNVLAVEGRNVATALIPDDHGEVEKETYEDMPL